MGLFIYTVFIHAYSLGFRIAALFNPKARAGIEGRKQTFSTISEWLRSSVSAETGTASKPIWMHCASLGEFEQGRPVLEALKKSFPSRKVILSFFSASGFEAMKNYPVADLILYLPFDNRANSKKFINAISPALVLWVKYEYWYYYLHELKRQEIPVLLISGIFRESQPFFKWYGTLWRKMLGCFTYFFVQNPSSKDLLAKLVDPAQVSVAGDTRFDRVIEIAENFKPIPFIEEFCGDSRVVVAGSTWEHDEAELTHYVKANPDIKFILAPHEIDAGNLKDVKEEFNESIFYSQLLKKEFTPSTANINMLIIDNIGMLSRLYYYADIVYVGGGFGAEGVHNVLEAAIYGKPVIHGPEYEKFVEAAELIECGGSSEVQNAVELEKILNELWESPALLQSKGIAARNYVYANQGASAKITRFVQEKRLLTN